MAYPVNDRNVFQSYRESERGNDDELDSFFPPLEEVVMPVPSDKYPASPQGPEEDDDENDMVSNMGPGSPHSAYDEPVGGLPPPTEPTFKNMTLKNMEAFRAAVQEAGVQDLFGKICADIILQRPDDVFRFTARKLRKEARESLKRRVTAEQLADKLRGDTLNKLALEEQQRKIEEMVHARSPKSPKRPEEHRTSQGHEAQEAECPLLAQQAQ